MPEKAPALIKGDVVADKEKITNAFAKQAVFYLLYLFIERNENIFGYFVKFFPAVSSDSLLIAEIQADKEGGQAEHGWVLLGKTEDVLK